MLAGETFVRKDQEPAQRESATAQSWGHQACRWHLCDSVFQKIYKVLCSSCEKEWEKCDRNKSADTKVIEVRGRGNAPGDRAKVSCSPREACGGTGWRSPWGSSGCGLEEACGRAGSWQELETSPRSNRMSGKSCSPWETRTGAVHPWRMTLVAWTHVGAVTEEMQHIAKKDCIPWGEPHAWVGEECEEEGAGELEHYQPSSVYFPKPTMMLPMKKVEQSGVMLCLGRRRVGKSGFSSVIFLTILFSF